MGCAALLFTLLHVFPVIGARAGEKKTTSTWSELSQWLTNNGGWYQDSIQSDYKLHGGAKIRGLVLESGSFMGSTLLEIPRHLWLELHFWPHLAETSLSHLSSCNGLDEKEIHRLKFASGLATETAKGDSSQHAMYLRHLPTLSDYQSFHPSFMNAALQQDFLALPTVGFAQTTQTSEAQMKGCFLAWKSEPQSPVQNVKWEDITLGLSHLRNRGFIVEHDPIMVPVVDLINTERSDLVNAQVDFNMDVVSLVTTSTWVGSDEELLYGYCNTCDNEVMLSQWGVYLEENTNALPAEHTVDCEGHGNLNSTNASSTSAKSLKEVSLAALDLGSYSEGNVPRCKKSVFSEEQGALRCSLARLSYEYCGSQWERDPGAMVNATSTKTNHSVDSRMFLKSKKASATHTSKAMDKARMVNSIYIPLNSTHRASNRTNNSRGSSALRKRVAVAQHLRA